MARESAQYLLPDRLEPADVGRVLAPALAVRPEPDVAGERSFYDTFDGRLHRSGMSLVYEAGRLVLLEDGYRERAGTTWPRPREEMAVADLPAGRLRELIVPVIEPRALTRVARLRSRRRPVRVLDDQAKTVVRLVLEEPELVGAGDGAPRPRLHAVAVRGYGKALALVCDRLEAELGLAPAEVSLQDEAVALAGGRPGGVSSKPRVQLEPDERADRAVARILRRLLEVIEANLPGTLADLDSEFLHDLRVAVRRTRSLQRQLGDVFPADRLAHFRGEFRWLQAATGPCRDLDVYVMEFDQLVASLPERRRGDLAPLRELLVRRRARERRRMARALRSARTRALLADWDELLAGLEGREASGSKATVPIARVASARIAKVHRQMVKAGARIDDASPAEALHELRKQAKELRYLLEFFGSLYPARVTKPMVRTLTGLQETLGRFQDREVQADLIRSLGDDVRALENGSAALMTMGQLVERLEWQQADARAEFAGRFAAFASPRQRTLARETFA